MMKRRKAVIIAYALVLALFLPACEKEVEVIDLVEPSSSVSTYRPVTRMDIGTPSFLLGNVVGTEYCHFYKKNVRISTIDVELGQYVKEGDVVATADIESAKNEIASLRSEINLLEEEHKLDQKEYEIKLKNLELAKEYAEYDKTFGFGTQASIENAKNNIEIEKENKEYNDLLYQFKKDKLNESIADLAEIVSDGTLKAKKSGYVTYVKDLNESMDALMNENVVKITDYEDLFIEAADMDISVYKYEKYEVKFAYFNNTKVKITEYNYSDAEKAYARAQGNTPRVRFKPVEDVKLNIGDYIVMCFYQKDKCDVIAVGKDSLKSDDEGVFVYVRNAEGVNEKRYIETGESDDHYTEVLSGLSEGEEVLYVQEQFLPEQKSETNASYGLYSGMESIKGVKYANSFTYSYLAKEKGEIEEIYVNGGDEIKKGDPLIKLAVESRKSSILDIENKITNEDRDHENAVNDFNEEYERLTKDKTDNKSNIDTLEPQLKTVKQSLSSSGLTDKERAELGAKKAKLEDSINRSNYSIKFDDYSLSLLEISKSREQKEHDSTIASLKKQLNEAKKENNGTGYETVYAKYDGVVLSNVSQKVGDKVKAGDVVVKTARLAESDVRFAGSSILESTGYTFKITDDNNSYEAVVISGNRSKKPNYFTENGKVYSTFSANKETTFVLRVSDSSFFKKDLSEYSAKIDSIKYSGMIVVSGEYIFSEKNFEGKESNYVWKLVNGMPVKEYVITGTNIGVGETMMPVILKGVSEGDVLVN